MNIVFWFLVILALAAVWLMLNPIFKRVGRFWINVARKTKKNMSADERTEGKEEDRFEQR